jgi:uncharacterized protein (TIGR03067 family)
MLLKSMRTVTALLAVTWPAAIAARGQDDAPKERERFQGTWTFVSVEANGKSLDDLFKDAKAVVKGNRLTLTFSGGGKLVRTFKVYTDTNPRCVDFLGADGKGEPSEGIYELKDKRLKILVNVNSGARERPVGFDAKKKAGHIYYVVKREE